MNTSRLRSIVGIAALTAANGLIYGLNALYYCFIQLYLSKFHTPASVGVLLSVGPLIAIFAPLFWGILADRAKYKNTIMLITVLGSAICYLLLPIDNSFVWLFLTMFLLMFFMSPFGGMIDTITLEYTSISGVAYGPIRLSGTLVFGIIPMILTPFTEKNIYIVFYVYSAVALLAALSIILMPKVSGHAKKSEPVDIKSIFCCFPLMLLFVAMAVSQFTWAYYLNFYPTFLTTELKMPQSVWGVCVFVSVLGEIPFFMLFNRIYKRFSLRTLVITGALLAVMRYLSLALLENQIAILAAALVTGLSPTLITYSASMYITRHIDRRMIATVQTLLYSMTSGIPKVLAGFCGGLITESIGVRGGMLLAVAFNAAAVVLFTIPKFGRQLSSREHS